MLKIKKASTVMPANKLMWKDLILSEAVNRLPDLDGRIENFRIINVNNEGTGMALITLVGSKAFIPIIIKEFEMQPIDIIFAKEGNKTDAQYLCKANILNLTLKSSIGRPVNKSTGVGDTSVNLMSPSGGNAYSSNPFYGMQTGQGIKTASLTKDEQARFDYAEKMLKEASLWTDDLDKVFVKEASAEEPKKSYLSISFINEQYKINTPLSKTASIVPYEEILDIFKSLDLDDRIEKTANLMANRHVIIGDHIPYKNNIFIKEEPKNEYLSTKTFPMPGQPNIYIYGGVPTYINPTIKDLDGNSKPSYGMAVRLGEFTIGKDFSGFKARGENSTAAEQLEDLLPQAVQLKSGDYFTMINDLDNSITIPLKVVMTQTMENKTPSITAKTLIGPSKTVEILFHNGSKIIRASDSIYMYPSYNYRILMLPKQFVQADEMLAAYDINKVFRIYIELGANSSYVIHENNKHLKHCKEDELFFTLVNRYGASEYQAIQVIRKLQRAFNIILKVKYIHDEPTITQLNDKQESVNNETSKYLEKEAKDLVDNSISVIKNLNIIQDRINSIYENDELLSKVASLDILMETELSKPVGMLKIAAEADGKTDGSQDGQDRADQSQQQMGMSGVSINMQGGLLNSLMSIPKMEKNTANIIDLLTFYSLGKIRDEDKMEMLKKLKYHLREAENILGKVLILTQLDKMPEQDYSDIKLLLSTIDSYRTTLDTTLVII